MIEALKRSLDNDINKLGGFIETFAQLESRVASGQLLSIREQEKIVITARILASELRDAYWVRKLPHLTDKP